VNESYKTNEDGELVTDIDLTLPCGHVAYKGRRPGLWINDEYLGWCQDCGCLYNAKVLRGLMERGELEFNNTAFIKQQGFVEKNKA
jgi:hypothetical protein